MTVYPSKYDPSQLIALERKRPFLTQKGELPFFGLDRWTAFELSWLNTKGKPELAIATVDFDCQSKNMIESKSFKLYLNSLNHQKISSASELKTLLCEDLTTCIGEPYVDVSLFLPSQWPELHISCPNSKSLDVLDMACDYYYPNPDLIDVIGTNTEAQSWYTRLFRSECPVTGQPDWATIQLDYHGPQLCEKGLLQYLVSFRKHRGFHEQCVEKIYMDLLEATSASFLKVEGRFLRRGGLDINPLRVSDSGACISSSRLTQQ